MEGLLEKVQERIQYVDPAQNLTYWLQDLDLAEDSTGNLVLSCPNAFTRRWLEEKYTRVLTTAFKEEMGKEVCLSFEVHPETGGRGRALPTPRTRLMASSLPDLTLDCHTPEERTVGLLPDPASQVHSGTGDSGPFPDWNPRYLFSSFVEGPSSQFACYAAQEVCRGYRRQYSPLLILGTTGTGKTHLGHAIARRLHQADPECRIRYCTAEGFYSEMIQHIRSKSIQSFKEKYRKYCDAFIMDDIQFLCGKAPLQSELGYTLDVLLNQEKQVILLGNLPSGADSGMGEELRSRLFSGLTVSLELPDYETRLQIIHQLAEASGQPFLEETLATLARIVHSNVRDLEGSFQRLAALQTFLQQPVDTEVAEKALQDLPWTHHPRTPSLRAIQEHVARHFGLDPKVLASKSRQKGVLYPRQVAIYLSRKHTPESLEMIGNLYKRDHSSVPYSVKSLEKKMGSNPRIMREVAFVEEKLLQKGIKH